MYDIEEVEALEAALDALGDSPTAAQILDVLKAGYRDAAVATALKRTAGGGGGGSSSFESFPFTSEDVQAICDNGVAATLTIFDEPNAGILFTAVTPGAAGNSITVELLAPGGTAALAVDVTDTAISVTLHDVDGTLVSTAAQVIAAVNNDGAASALVTATNAPGSTGAGIPDAAAESPLDNGADPSGVNFLALTTGHPGDRIFGTYCNIETSMNNFSGGCQLAAILDPEGPAGDATALGGAQEWDITSTADTVENGVSLTSLANSAAHIADAGAYWPLTVSEETTIGVILTDDTEDQKAYDELTRKNATQESLMRALR